MSVCVCGGVSVSVGGCGCYTCMCMRMCMCNMCVYACVFSSWKVYTCGVKRLGIN